MTFVMLLMGSAIVLLLAVGVAGGVLTISRARRQVEELSGENARLSAEVALDPLTGLANRRGIVRALDAALARPQSLTAVLYLDLDHFKNVNDDHGHRCGDRALVATADRLLACLPRNACGGRMGGDEIVIVLPSIGSLDEASQIATEIRQCLAHPIALDGLEQPLHLTVSIGVAATTPGLTDDADDLIERANQALRQAKAAGRDRVMSR